ncbi:MAG: HEPN domain-containing protein [Rhodospirillales bacterium]|nr:HEPN domain-containing protein [Rhodospirillales bacterium]
METETLTSALSAAVDQAAFDLECTAIEGDGTSGQPSRQRVSSAGFREAYLRDRDRSVKLYARASVPEAAMTRLVDAVRCTLREFHHPDTDRIGHAFPVDGSDIGRGTFRPDGLYDEESQSPVREFTLVLVRAAAIMGAKEATGLLVAWKQGQPVNLRMCTVLSGLPLTAPLTLGRGIRIVPLALSTAELPRLPTRRDTAPRDYLGLSLLSMQLSASPALFRPDPDRQDGSVRSSSVDGFNFDLACQALSLRAGDHVSTGFVWHEYPDAAPFCITKEDTWGPVGDNQLRPRGKKEASHDPRTGVWTITPSDDAQPLCLDEEDLSRIIEALRHADEKLSIAVGRWRRSKRPESRLEDSYIDLRIALEALYLKDFDDERSQEMRFRLPLFGAWHLAEKPEERRSICKTLRAAYDMASKVVHGGEVVKGSGAGPYWEARAELDRAQDLCRRGILKLLREGPPRDWTDLVLGGPDP